MHDHLSNFNCTAPKLPLYMTQYLQRLFLQLLFLLSSSLLFDLLQTIACALCKFGDFSFQLESLLSFRSEILTCLFDLLQKILPLSGSRRLFNFCYPSAKLFVYIFELAFVPLFEFVILDMQLGVENLELYLVLAATRIDIIHVIQLRRLISLLL